MADRKSQDAPDEAEAPSGGGKKKSLVVMGLIAVVIAAVGYILGGRGSPAPVAEPVGTVPEPSPAESLAEIVELDALNVNLAGGHYLRIAVAIGLAAAEEGDAAAASAHSAADTTEASIATAPAKDLVVSTFAGRDMTVLATPEGRETARQDLHSALSAFYGVDISSVMFTEFVMQ